MAYRATKASGRSWRLERNLLRPFVVRYWRREAESLTERTWDEDHRPARRAQKTRRGLPPRDITINLELARTRGMFSWAVRKKLIAVNPLAACKKVKTRNRRESYFTEAQLETLADGARYLRWHKQREAFRVFVAVMVGAALRISEALAIRWDRIADNGTTTILGKGNKTRVVAFPVDVLEEMKRLDRHDVCPFVFTNWNTGKPYSCSTVRDWFQQVIEATGLEAVKASGDLRLVPHVLRHSAASMAENRGATITMVQKLLGHASPETTRVYLHREETDAALHMARIMAKRKPRRAPRRAAQESTSLPSPSKEKVATKNAHGVRYFS